MSHRPPTVQEVFKSHIGIKSIDDVRRDWVKLEKQMRAIVDELLRDGYQDVDLNDPHDVDKLLYTIKDANPSTLSKWETWERDEAHKVFNDYKFDFLAEDTSGHWQIPSKPLIAFVGDKGVNLERREPQGASSHTRV